MPGGEDSIVVRFLFGEDLHPQPGRNQKPHPPPLPPGLPAKVPKLKWVFQSETIKNVASKDSKVFITPLYVCMHVCVCMYVCILI